MAEQPYQRAGVIAVVARSADVMVQERTLQAGQVIPWHYHSTIADTAYALEGTVSIERLGPRERVLLTPGQRLVTPPGRPHQVTSAGPGACRFLLIQGVGPYDRHPIDPATWKG
jgi:quercetin dioxygenase-like cupin family protein